MTQGEPRLLDDEEVVRQLRELSGWSADGAADGAAAGSSDRLLASYQAPDFRTAVQLVDEVAAEAEVMDHHPDIDLRWRTVTFYCSTHSAGGVTQRDVELAHRVSEWAQRLGATAVEA